MGSGRPKFVAARLTEAREARGIHTLITLAGLLGVSTSSVSRWEDGQSEPSSEKLLELADKLNVRPSFFLRPQFEHGDAPVFFRSLASARKRDLKRQRARLRWLQEVSVVVQHYIRLPNVDIPELLGGESYRSLRDEDLEHIASALRRHWGLGDLPIPNVVDVLERAGFVIGCDEMGTTTLDGLCNWSELDGRPYLLLAKDKMSFFRRQMDAAHEMAHAILHRNVREEQLKDDFDIIEKQAFRLASAFLMPASAFALAVRKPTLSKLLILKDRWRVSVKAMIRRCRDLKLISKDDERQLYKYYSAKGWTREEPLDRNVAIAKPSMLAEALTMIVDSGSRPKQALMANDFTIPGHDVEELVCLDEGWFERSPASVIQLREFDRPSVKGIVGPGNVVAFEAGLKTTKRD